MASAAAATPRQHRKANGPLSLRGPAGVLRRVNADLDRTALSETTPSCGQAGPTDAATQQQLSTLLQSHHLTFAQLPTHVQQFWTRRNASQREAVIKEIAGTDTATRRRYRRWAQEMGLFSDV